MLSLYFDDAASICRTAAPRRPATLRLLARLSTTHLPAVLVRLVRMTFQPDKVDTFLRIFDESAPRIRAFPGCRHLELLQDDRYPNILTTISHWDHDDALQRYRSSNLFRGTWTRTKALFAAPPTAHSHALIRHVSGQNNT